MHVIAVLFLLVLGGGIAFSLLLLRALMPSRPTAPNAPPHLVISLGSGGHTAEMFALLRGIPNFTTRFPKRTYVYSRGDALSAEKAAAFERKLNGRLGKDFNLESIPRARMVGQGWGSVPASATKCLMGCLIVLQQGGDVVLMNGPGNAVMLVVGCIFLRMFSSNPKKRMVYVESFARVKDLSLSGKLVYPFVDRFLVQWEGLREKWPKAEYKGVLV